MAQNLEKKYGAERPTQGWDSVIPELLKRKVQIYNCSSISKFKFKELKYKNFEEVINEKNN